LRLEIIINEEKKVTHVGLMEDKKKK